MAASTLGRVTAWYTDVCIHPKMGTMIRLQPAAPVTWISSSSDLLPSASLLVQGWTPELADSASEESFWDLFNIQCKWCACAIMSIPHLKLYGKSAFLIEKGSIRGMLSPHCRTEGQTSRNELVISAVRYLSTVSSCFGESDKDSPCTSLYQSQTAVNKTLTRSMSGALVITFSRSNAYINVSFGQMFFLGEWGVWEGPIDRVNSPR